jgi:hypothetical protein
MRTVLRPVTRWSASNSLQINSLFISSFVSTTDCKYLTEFIAPFNTIYVQSVLSRLFLIPSLCITGESYVTDSSASLYHKFAPAGLKVTLTYQRKENQFKGCS